MSLRKLKLLRIKYIHEAALPDILSAQQVADYTGLSESFINSLMKDFEVGEPKGLPNFKVRARRLIRKPDLLKWLKAREQEMLWTREKNRKYKKTV